MIRFFDVLFSSLALLVLYPFMLPIIILLKLTGEHDVLYRQKRIGRYGEPFYVLKFATMLRNSPNMPGGLITAENDPRLLPFGKFLRKTKINELPQLINVLLGQMSLVGYRPLAEAHYNLYSSEVKDVLGRIRPGLSGIGSIVFKNEEAILHRVADRDYVHDKLITPYKGKLEMWYVENRSLANYFIILFLTIWSFVKPDSNAVYRIFKDIPACPVELQKYIHRGRNND
jgi:lipopolysaccharide/colanic/teichoic acid biosynthesis glycosyltransferase